MQRFILPLISTLTLAACQSTQQSLPLPPKAYSLEEPFYQAEYAPEHHNVSLASYAEQLVLLLQQNIEPQKAGNIAVASFVDFDTTLLNSHALGNQLAERFITQLRRFGFTVVDTKANKQLQITSKGDFIFSRPARRVVRNQQLTSILAGTLIYTPRGIEVNSRILDLSTQTVLASAAITIPYFVVNHLAPPQYLTIQ